MSSRQPAALAPLPPLPPLPDRLRGAASTLLSKPWLFWFLAAVFAIRDLVLNLLAGDRPDAANAWRAGHLLLTDPAHLYSEAASALARTGFNPVPGHGWLYPPAAAWLVAPFGSLPEPSGVAALTAADALAMIAGLFLLYRMLRPQPVAAAVFWLVAAYFPPLFAEVNAGQIGGFLLLMAMGSLYLTRRSQLLAGVLAGLATSVKIYPAALLLGALPRRLQYGAGLIGAAALASLAAFVPLGPKAVQYYFRQVLLPSLSSRLPDCAITSVRTLYMRLLGGESYVVPRGPGLATITLPLHAPLLAGVLADLTIVAIVLAAIWAAWRSGWNQHYAIALGFAMGALVPGEVNPYQVLPILPVVLMVTVRAWEAGRWRVLGLLGVGLLGLIRQPCDLLFPNLWTLATLLLYAVVVWQYGLFRTGSDSTGGGGDGGAERPGQLHLDRARFLAGAERQR